MADMKKIEYTSSRLCFKAAEIEPLQDTDVFIIRTPQGVFQFTKAEFYRDFSNVVKTKSYKEDGIYHYSVTPKRALSYLIDEACVPGHNQVTCKDLVGDDIRSKIREIGTLWHSSKYNPSIDPDVIDKWEKLIDDWIEDFDMPLIVRKETDKRGQAFIHRTGREIIIADNTVALWIYGHVLKGEVFTLNQIRDLLMRNELPVVFMATKEIKEKAKYSKSLGKNPLSHWKLCHIESVGFNTNTPIVDIEIADIKEHFRKYVSPKNMFVLPKEIGDLGEIAAFIEEQK